MDVDSTADDVVAGNRRRQSGETQAVDDQRRRAAQWAKDNLGVRPSKTGEVWARLFQWCQCRYF